MTLPNNDGAPTSDVFALEDQLRKQEESQTPAPTVETPQQVPYDRFKEVNDEKKRLFDIVEGYQRSQAQVPQTPVVTQPEAPKPFDPANLFTTEELQGFETELVVSPGEALQKITKTIFDRGVTREVNAVREDFNSRFQQLENASLQQAIPTAIDNFKRSRFANSDPDFVTTFDTMVAQIAKDSPASLANPQTLENVRLASIGYVTDQRSAAGYRAPQRAPFSETPGMSAGWANAFGQNQQQGNNTFVPPEVITAGKQMGLSEAELRATYLAMNQSGVFR